MDAIKMNCSEQIGVPKENGAVVVVVWGGGKRHIGVAVCLLSHVTNSRRNLANLRKFTFRPLAPIELAANFKFG